MHILGSLAFYSTFINNLHVDSKPFNELFREDALLKWTKKCEKLFETIKDRTSEEIIPAVPNPKYPFYLHVVFSSTGIYQEFASRKCVNSFNF